MILKEVLSDWEIGYPEKDGGGIPKKTEENNTSINNKQEVLTFDYQGTKRQR